MATDRVNIKSIPIGAKKVSGLSFKGWVAKVITDTTRKI